MAGVASLCLILLVAVGPIWLAEKLEPVETAREGTKSAEEIIVSEDTTTSYAPFVEFSNVTACPRYREEAVDGSSYAYYYTSPGNDFYELDGGVVFNCDNYMDMIPLDNGNSINLYVLMDADPNEMLSNGIYDIYFNLSCDSEIYISGCYWYGLTENTLETEAMHSVYPFWDGHDVLGNHHTGTVSIDHAVLNDIVTEIGSSHNHAIMLKIWVDSPATNNLYIDMQVQPEYYEETTTTYNNETVTTWEPYIQTFTPYRIHKWGMALGGVLVLVTALIVSPLPIGESFDSFFPINSFSASTRKRTKSYRRKRRRR
jgi:hypothetical protein